MSLDQFEEMWQKTFKWFYLGIVLGMNLLKMCGPQIRLCLFKFRPIASKQLNSFTTMDTLSWLGGAVGNASALVQEVPGSIPSADKGFYVWIFVLFLLRFYSLSKNTLVVTKICNYFCNVSLFSALNILQDFWPIIRV